MDGLFRKPASMGDFSLEWNRTANPQFSDLACLIF